MNIWQIVQDYPGLALVFTSIILVCVIVIIAVFQRLQQKSNQQSSDRKGKKSTPKKTIIFVVPEYEGLQSSLTDSMDCFAREVLVKQVKAEAKKGIGRLTSDDFKFAADIKRSLPYNADICVELDIKGDELIIRCVKREFGYTKPLDGLDLELKKYKISGTTRRELEKFNCTPIITVIITAIKGPRVDGIISGKR